MLRLHPEISRAVLDELALGLVLVDARGLVTWANAHALVLVDRTLDELVGRDVRALSLPYTAPDPRDGEPALAVHGPLIGLTQRAAATGGAILTVCERSHPLVGFLGALVSGLPGRVAANGVLPRAAVKGRLEAEVSRSRRYTNPLSCITVAIRDADPDATGSALARVLKEQLRWVDVLGQWSDDVLLVVLPETTAEAATALRAKLVDAFAQAVVEGAIARGSFAIGCAAWQRGDSAERIVARALASARERRSASLRSVR
ncbi:MAG: diguanylate cyclase [Gammaproteobacteria bacterium]